MTWTYSTVLTANKDLVRYLVGDTDTTEQLVSDEEITNGALVRNPDVNLAAAEIADRIALKFARDATTRVGDTHVNFSDRARQYAALAVELRSAAGMRGARSFAGGISKADKDTREEDTDRVLPGFTRGMHGTPGLWPETTEEEA